MIAGNGERFAQVFDQVNIYFQKNRGEELVNFGHDSPLNCVDDIGIDCGTFGWGFGAWCGNIDQDAV